MRSNDPLDPGFGFDLIRLSASRTEIVVQQQRDLDANVHDNDELAALIDRIAARIGGKRVVVHLPQDTHIPERAVLAVPAQHHLAAATQAAWPERVAERAAAAAVAAVRKARADQGAVRDRARRAAASIHLARASPMRWCGSRAPSASRWNGGSRTAQTLTRDYFRVEDEAGLRFWIFRDGLYDSELADEEGEPVAANWFVHGLFA